MHVLIVDDSVVFRSQIKNALEKYPEISAITVAANGQIALAKLEQQSIDLVILDLEMPQLDGIGMLHILRERGFKQRVIVFSASSTSGVRTAFEALKQGADDFVAKPHGTNSLEESLQILHHDLIPKVLQFSSKAKKKVHINESSLHQQQRENLAHSDRSKSTSFGAYPKTTVETFKPSVIAIGSSTGGPTALDKIFATLKEVSLRIPILIVQHMPPVFTANLAKRLSEISGHPAAEGRHGEIIKPGKIYVAPGDYHMSLMRTSSAEAMIKLDQTPKRNSVRPAVDNLFESCANIYGGMTAAMVLTGMGEDGMAGAIKIKEARGAVIIQDEESSVVWGMPGSVFASGAFDIKASLEECALHLRNMAI